MQPPVQMRLNPAAEAVLGLASQPKPPRNVFYEATELDRVGNHPKAERIYLELLNADFDNPVILAALGMCYAAQERNGLGYSLLIRALERVNELEEGFKRLGVTPKSDKINSLEEFKVNKKSEILNAIGTCHKHENRIDEARRYFEHAQSLIATNPDIQNNLATLYINEGRPENAIQHLDAALSIYPDHPQAKWNKSLVLLEMGNYVDGWPLYDAGFTANVRNERNYATQPMPVWDGTPGKRIVVYGEQGIGDEIMFASMLPELIERSELVVFDCHKYLHGLFHSSFPGIDIYPTREDPQVTWPVDPTGKSRYNFDARIAIGSLGQFFRPYLPAFPGTPYIHPNPEKVAYWKERLKFSTKPKIGISWIGGHKRTRIEVRSLNLEQMLPILSQDATFVSLQYTDCQDEIASFVSKHGHALHYFPEATHSNSYENNAALIANLDLVITVCTSVVHLSGSMGVPTWVLTPSRPAWRYRLDLEYMPWYGKTVTLFRQEPGSVAWEPVVAEVGLSLKELLS